MFCDAPVVKYKKETDGKKPGEPGFKPMKAWEARELVKNFKKRKLIPTKKEYDLDAYMKTGEKKEKN